MITTQTDVWKNDSFVINHYVRAWINDMGNVYHFKYDWKNSQVHIPNFNLIGYSRQLNTDTSFIQSECVCVWMFIKLW